MIKRFLIFVVFLSLLFFSCSVEKVDWPESTNEMRPWVRWHWMANAVDEENIKRELKEFSNVGIGGVEITSGYGAKGEEHRFIEYHSPEFTRILKFTINEAHSLGMGVDLPPSAGWACGGPFVPEEKGLGKLRINSYDLKAGATWELPEDINAAAISFVAKEDDGSATILQLEEKFVAPVGGKIYIAEQIKTGGTVKNPSPGGEGLVIDIYNKEINDWYLSEFWNRLGLDKGLIRSFFHDSFEYYGDFSLHFMEEFKTRRGYDLAEYMHVLAGDYKNEETLERIRSDYRETLSDLVLESSIKPMVNWAKSHQSLLRNQAHGSPGNILDIYAASDIPETETFGPIETDKVSVFVHKFASSAAHITSKKLVSSESFTWLNEHWTVTTTDMIRAVNRLFLGGINHIIFNNCTYSPDDAEWPGWVYYASTQMHNRNPLWRELPALFKYIELSQSILQSATPQNDLLVYWPFYDVASSDLGDFAIYNFTNIDRGDNAPWFKNFSLAGLSENLMNSGYAFDYISDDQLLNCEMENGKVVTSTGVVYKAVVVPKTKYIPVETIQQLKKFITEGGKVYFEESLPESVPGMFELSIRKQKLEEIKKFISKEDHVGDVKELLANSNIVGKKFLSEKGFHFLKMNMDNENWYMILNCSTEVIDEWVKLNNSAKSYVFLDPMSGKISRAKNKGNSVHIQLEPERAVFIKCCLKNVDAPQFTYVDMEAKRVEIKGSWDIDFIEGGAVLPGNITTEKLTSWTILGDTETQKFAGTARYTIKFEWNENTSLALLNLGNVKDCARVKLNGKVLGSLLGPSYTVKVDNLINGENLLEIEVTNVAANRIRDYDIRGVVWKKFYRTNGDFADINYRPFDASGWDIREAGLLGPVDLTPIR